MYSKIETDPDGTAHIIDPENAIPVLGGEPAHADDKQDKPDSHTKKDSDSASNVLGRDPVTGEDLDLVAKQRNHAEAMARQREQGQAKVVDATLEQQAGQGART